MAKNAFQIHGTDERRGCAMRQMLSRKRGRDGEPTDHWRAASKPPEPADVGVSLCAAHRWWQAAASSVAGWIGQRFSLLPKTA